MSSKPFFVLEVIEQIPGAMHERSTHAEALAVHDPQALRDDAILRARVAAQAKEISSIMDAYMS